MQPFEQIVLAIMAYSVGCTALIIHLIYKLHKADQGIDKVIKNYVDKSITQDLTVPTKTSTLEDLHQEEYWERMYSEGE